MSPEGPISDNAGQDARKYIEDLGMKDGEAYEFVFKDGRKFNAIVRLRTLGTLPGNQRIILEGEDGTNMGISNTNAFKEINPVDPETKQRVVKAIQSRNQGGDGYFG